MSSIFELPKQTAMGTERVAEGAARLEVDGPVVKEVPGGDKGDYFDAEIARLVQTLYFSGGRAPNRLLFCGVDEANGSSVVCASAGRALSVRSQSVCLLDANVRGPRLFKVFGVDSTDPGRRGPLPARDRLVQVSNHLWLAGTEVVTDESGSLIPITELKVLLSRLQGIYGTVFIDAPGTSASRDAAVLGQLADAAILVVEANSTRKMAARKAKEFLEGAGVKLIGTILNNRSFPIPEKLYRRL